MDIYKPPAPIETPPAPSHYDGDPSLAPVPQWVRDAPQRAPDGALMDTKDFIPSE